MGGTQAVAPTEGVLAMVSMAGCPSEFGKDGRVAKAIHRDTLELVRRHCAEPELRDVCSGPNKDPEACRECGGELANDP
jgi:hypothetical protein